MPKLSLKSGSTSTSLNIFIQDSTSTTGGGKTGLAYNTASLIAYYVLPGTSPVAIALATQTVTGAWSSGGFVEIDSVHLPGTYRLDVPNAALTGAKSCFIMLSGATGMVPLPLEIELTAVDNQSATSFVTSVPSVVGAVGSVTNPVTLAGTQTFNNTGTWTGNVTGSVGSVTTVSAGAITTGSFATGTYAIQVGLDFTNIKQATAATTLSNITIPTVSALDGSVVLGSVMGGAITSAAFASGAYPIQAGLDFTNIKQATVATTLSNITVPTVTTVSGTPTWYTIPPTTAQNATAVWQDSTAGDFNVAGSVGIRLMTGTSLLDSVLVENGTPAINARQSLSLLTAGVGGTLAGAGTSIITINGAGTSTVRITDTNPDGLGNRSQITLNLPA